MNLEDLKKNVRQYLTIKGEIELLTKRQSELKSRLTEILDSDGEADDRGHLKLTVEDPFKGEVTLVKQRRVSKNLDMNVAETLLEERGIKDSCIKMVPTLDEAAIMASFYEGKLTEADIDAMFPAKVSYAFILDVK